MLTAFILVVISANGTVSLQEFNSERACKRGMSTIGYDADAKSFRRGFQTYCIPKDAEEPAPAQK